MSAFQPTKTLLTPADPPDYLSNAVLQSLSRPPPERYTWGAFTTFLFGALSFGVLPLLFPFRRGRQFRLIERDQLLHLSEWMRQQNPQTAATLPMKHDDIHRDASVWFFIGLASAFVTMWIVASHVLQGGWRVVDLLHIVYGTQRQSIWPQGSFGDVWLDRLLPVMLVGQFAYWWTFVSQSLGGRAFARRFNEFAKAEGLAPVAIPEVSLGFRPLWITGAIIFISLHAPWGAVMMLAGGAQRRYIRHTSTQLRLELAQRVRDVMAVKRPLAKVPVATHLRHTCRDEKCRSPLPAVAKFCPRCGKKVTEAVDRVA